jgi:hypothetical protein
MSYLRYLCLFAYGCVQRILCCFFRRLVYHHDIGNPDFGLEQTQKYSRLNVYILYTAHFMQYKNKLVK